MDQVGVGLLGCGVVGASAVRAMAGLPTANAPAVRRVAVRDIDKPRACPLPTGVLTDDPWAVMEDPAVDVVVEVMGGLAPAADLLRRAILLGKPVVTANKAVLGAFGPALRAGAAAQGTPLLFEAAVAGAVPLIRGLSGLLRADNLIKIEGVLNGTTTFVLSHMAQTRASLHEALDEAQRLGYAEADSTRDLNGGDSADKLAVLVQYLFGEPLESRDVYRFGIEKLTLADIVGDRDHCWRLVATAVRGKCARVEPVPLRRQHPFAALTGPQNAVTITGERSGAVTLIGAGAGGDATACSIVADVLAAVDWLDARRPRATVCLTA